MAGASLGLSSTRSLTLASSLTAAREGKQKLPKAWGWQEVPPAAPCCDSVWGSYTQLWTQRGGSDRASFGGSHPEPCPINTVEMVPTDSDSHLWSELPPQFSLQVLYTYHLTVKYQVLWALYLTFSKRTYEGWTWKWWYSVLRILLSTIHEALSYAALWPTSWHLWDSGIPGPPCQLFNLRSQGHF